MPFQDIPFEPRDTKVEFAPEIFEDEYDQFEDEMEEIQNLEPRPLQPAQPQSTGPAHVREPEPVRQEEPEELQFTQKQAQPPTKQPQQPFQGEEASEVPETRFIQEEPHIEQQQLKRPQLKQQARPPTRQSQQSFQGKEAPEAPDTIFVQEEPRIEQQQVRRPQLKQQERPPTRQPQQPFQAKEAPEVPEARFVQEEPHIEQQQVKRPQLKQQVRQRQRGQILLQEIPRSNEFGLPVQQEKPARQQVELLRDQKTPVIDILRHNTPLQQEPKQQPPLRQRTPGRQRGQPIRQPASQHIEPVKQEEPAAPRIHPGRPRKLRPLHSVPRRKQVAKVRVLNRYSHKNNDGGLTWGYENTDGSFKEETIGVDCVTLGRYGYVEADGQVREFTYQTGVPCDPLTKQPLNLDTNEEQSFSAGQQKGPKAKQLGYFDYGTNRFITPSGRRVKVVVNKNHRRRG